MAPGHLLLTESFTLDIYLMDFFEIFLVMLSNGYKTFESRLPTLDKVSGLLLCSLCTFL